MRDRLSNEEFTINMGLNDGTPIVFSRRPAIDGETFFSRKGFYCINLQLVCDDRGFIRSYLTGWPGSVFDNSLFEKTRMFTERANYFSEGEYLLADSGYALSPICATPYRKPQSNADHNKLFNELFSSARGKIEHVNGILKSRWSSLKGIPTQIKQKSDFAKVNHHIIACIILYNLLLKLKDHWVEDEDVAEDGRVGAVEMNLREEDRDAKQLRIYVQSECLTWYYNNRA